MISIKKLLLGTMISIALPVSAFAEEPGFFAGVDVSGGAAWGSSSTKDGGAPFSNGGVVRDVKFGGTVGIGGHIGYQFNPAWSAFISYQHTRGNISWDADFPQFFNETSLFAGKAISDAIMANIAYKFHLSDATSIQTSAGLGVTFNTLSGVVETDKGTGLFVSDVANHTTSSAIAQLGAGVRHKITPNWVLGLDVTVAYIGGFETGNTRFGNLGTTDIVPYKIDNVWRTNLVASMQYRF